MKKLREIGMALPLLLGFGSAALAQDAAKPDAARTAPPATIVLMTKDTVVAADGSYVETLHMEMHANNAAAAPQIGQIATPYDMARQDLTVVEAHTLKADGKILPVKPDAIYEKLPQGQDSQEVTSLRSKVIVFPQVSGGDTVAYTIKLTDRQPNFPGQFIGSAVFPRTLPLDAARETITVPKDMPLTVETHDMAFSKRQDGEALVYSWQFAQPDPIAEEPVTYTPLAHQPRFFVSTFPDYAAMGRAYAAMTQSKRVVTPAVQALADQLTQGVRGRRDQAQKLYEWVSGHIRYVGIELGQGSLVPHDVDAILANGYGDCKDHDVLLQSLLQAKGIVSQSVLINGGASYEMPQVASLATLNHVITYVPEFKLYLDSTAQIAPFGVLPLNEYGKAIVTVSPDAASLGTMALLAPGVAKLAVKTDTALDKDGNLSGTTVTTASGPYSINLRYLGLSIQAAGAQSFAAKLLAALNYQNATGSFSETPPQTLAPDYTITGTFKSDGWGAVTNGNNRFYLPGGMRLFAITGDEAMGPITPGELKDGEPTLCYSANQAEDLSLKAPPDRKFGAVPQDVRIETPNLLFTAHWSQDGDTMRVHREFTSKIDQIFCSGDARKKAVAALKEISASYDPNLWFVRSADAMPDKAPATSNGAPAGKPTTMAMAAPASADPAEALYKQAIAEVAGGKTDAAVKDYTQYLALRPDNATAYFDRGMAYNRLGKPDQGLADFQHATALKPDYVNAWIESGVAHHALHQYDKAVLDYGHAVALNAGNVIAWQDRGLAYLALLQFDPALADFKKAAGLNPQDAELSYDQGMAHNGLGDRTQAIADFSAAIKSNPDYALAYEQRGNDYSSIQQYTNSIADLDQAIKLSPDEARIYYNRGVAYFRKGDYAQTIADDSKAIVLRSDYQLAYFERGLSYNNSRQFDLAIADFTKSLSLKPDDAPTLNDRGLAYRNLNQFASAIADLDRAIKLKPDYSTAYYNRGLAYAVQNQFERALTDYDEAIRLDAKYVFAYQRRGDAQRQLSHYAQAIADESQALTLRPGDTDALLYRANAYLGAGQAEQAISDCTSAIALKPDLAQAYYLRGLAERKLNQGSQADTDSSKAAALKPNP